MARFDVCRLRDGGLVLDVQADILDELRTRIIVPLLKRDDAPPPAKYLNPIFRVEGEEYVMKTEFLSAVDRSVLGQPTTNLAPYSAEITRALDMVFQGF